MPPLHPLLAVLAFATALLTPASAQSTTRVSIDSIGLQGNGASHNPSLSADKRYVAFRSAADNLVPGDANGTIDVFVRDRSMGLTTRVSVDSLDGEGNGDSDSPSISADGRFVAFWSRASNLVPGDANSATDVFVHDRWTGSTACVSVDSAGVLGNGDSGGTPSEGEGLAISADGRYVAFKSLASDLVPGDTNGWEDVFVHDRLTGQTARLSVDSSGGQADSVSWAPSISGDGRFVAFASSASNLVPEADNQVPDVFLHDRWTGQTTRISQPYDGRRLNAASSHPSLSADGRFIAFTSGASNIVPDDWNGRQDVFVHNRLTGHTARVSVDSTGVAANEHSYFPSISADGRYVAFTSRADNLIPRDRNGLFDVFVNDHLQGQTIRVSESSSGAQGNADSGDPLFEGPTISADGLSVAFHSRASNLVPGDVNGASDVFVQDRGPQLARTGACPGTLTLTASDATPGGQVLIVYGPAGVFVKTTPPCAGITLGVSSPARGTLRDADGAGTLVLSLNAPPGWCGLSLQAVDVTTCNATNVVVL